MAIDLQEKLKRLHELELSILLAQLEEIYARIESGESALVDANGQAINVLDKLKAVEAALKRNCITSAVEGASKMSDLNRLASKLNFKGISEKRKVVPIIREEVS